TLMRRIASSFGDDHVGALNFVFATHSSMSEDFTPFDPQIAVLNLNELRHEGTAERIVGLLADIDISYADALQIAVGRRYRDLDNEWTIRANGETADSTSIVNWSRETRHFSQMALNR